MFTKNNQLNLILSKILRFRFGIPSLVSFTMGVLLLCWGGGYYWAERSISKVYFLTLPGAAFFEFFS